MKEEVREERGQWALSMRGGVGGGLEEVYSDGAQEERTNGSQGRRACIAK